MANRWRDDGGERSRGEKREPRMITLIRLASEKDVFVEPLRFQLRDFATREVLAQDVSYAEALDILQGYKK